MTRWHGLKDLLVDALHHGVTGVETVHRRTARTTIEIVARVPGLGGPARAIGALQDAAIAATYEAIRQVNAAVGTVVGLVLDATERSRIDGAGGLPGPSHSRSTGGEKP
jgi:hypothetical protein